MSNVSEIMASFQTVQTMSSDSTKEVSKSTSKKTNASGKTIGNPQLSDNALKYYEELKKKYSNTDFILVSKDQKEFAKAQAGSYANANKMVVLIDEDKIERMAEDENYRRHYEQIIANAAVKMPQMSAKLSSTGANVKGYGVQVNDNGTASYFAVIDKMTEAQKERIEKKAEQKKEARKAAEKEAAKEAEEERYREKIEKQREDKKFVSKDSQNATVTVTASSFEELLQKIEDLMFNYRSDNALTNEERAVGQNINFSV